MGHSEGRGMLKNVAVDKENDNFHFHLSTHSNMSEALFKAEQLSMHSPVWHCIRVYFGELPVIETNSGEIQSGLFYWREVNSFLEEAND